MLGKRHVVKSERKVRSVSGVYNPECSRTCGEKRVSQANRKQT